MSPRCGEVWTANLNPVAGHEQMGTRPVLVISDDRFNAAGLELVVIVPLTTKPRPFGTRVPIHPPEAGLTAAGQIICEQPRTISVERLGARLGTVTMKTMQQVSEIIRTLLAL
jgi:mRNA interferase MazF